MYRKTQNITAEYSFVVESVISRDFTHFAYAGFNRKMTMYEYSNGTYEIIE